MLPTRAAERWLTLGGVTERATGSSESQGSDGGNFGLMDLDFMTSFVLYYCQQSPKDRKLFKNAYTCWYFITLHCKKNILCVKPVLKSLLLREHNMVPPVSLKPATPNLLTNDLFFLCTHIIILIFQGHCILLWNRHIHCILFRISGIYNHWFYGERIWFICWWVSQSFR